MFPPAIFKMILTALLQGISILRRKEGVKLYKVVVSNI